MDLEGKMIIVDADMIVELIKEAVAVAIKPYLEDVKKRSFEEKLTDLMGSNPMVTSSVVMKMTGWSRPTFNRRLVDDVNPIPMTKDGKGWVMNREVFIKYYNETFHPQT